MYAQHQEDVVAATESALTAIRAIPTYQVTPTTIAALTAAVAALAYGLAPEPQEVAQRLLDQCYDELLACT